MSARVTARDPAATRAALEAGEVRRALFVRLGRVGELLFCTPAIAAFAARWPAVEIGVAAPPGAIEVLRGNPSIARWHALPRPSWKAAWARRRAFAELAAVGYDLVVHLGGKEDPDALAGRIGARLIHDEPGAEPTDPHIAAGKHGVLRALGVEAEPGPLVLHVDDEGRRHADALAARLQGTGPLVVIQAACHSSGRVRLRQSTVKRRWEPRNYAEVARRLVERLDARILVNAATATEAREARLIIAGLGARATIVDRESLSRLAGVLDRAALLITVDTGPLHMAVALGTPVVLLHGPTDHRITGPWRPTAPVSVLWKGLECSPCRGPGKSVACDDNQCLKQIEPADVAAEAKRLLGQDVAPGLGWPDRSPIDV